MAYVHKHVSIGGGTDSTGKGAYDDPYNSLQYAINDNTVRAGGHTFWLYGAEVLSASLDFSSYGSPTYNQPCCIRGWDGSTDEGDGDGIGSNSAFDPDSDTWDGSIDGNDGDFVVCAKNSVTLFNLKVHNSGTADIIDQSSGYHSGVFGCEITNGANGVDGGTAQMVMNCYIHNISGYGVDAGIIHGNYFKDGASNFTKAIDSNITSSDICRNIFSLQNDTIAIEAYAYNRVFSNSMIGGKTGSGKGITTSTNGALFWNNLIEGFVDAISTTTYETFVANNAYYNCTNGFTFTQDNVVGLSNLAVLDATPFHKTVTDNFLNRFTYFKPKAADTTPAIHGQSWPGGLCDIGAVQHDDPAAGGGGGVKLTGPGGGMIG